MTKQERTLKQIETTLKNVSQQCEDINYFLQELCKESPEYNTYYRLFDYIWGSIFDIEEKIKTL